MSVSLAAREERPILNGSALASAGSYGRQGSVVLSTDLFSEQDRKRRRCTRKTCCIALFLILAIIQGVIVISLQISVSSFDSDDFIDDRQEATDFLQNTCSCWRTATGIVTMDDIPVEDRDMIIRDMFIAASTEQCPYTMLISNFTNGSNVNDADADEDDDESFGQDKQIYIFFFIGFVIYNFFSLLHALWTKDIIEVYFFLVLNFLLVLYSFQQVYQFRSFRHSGLEDIGFIALANAVVMLVFTLVFVLFTFEMHTQFGWWIFTWLKVKKEKEQEQEEAPGEEEDQAEEEEENLKVLTPTSHLRFYYRYYQMTVATAKLLVLFSLLFFVGQMVLFLWPCDWEWGGTLAFALLTPLFLLTFYIAIRNEIIVLTVLLLIGILCLCGYYLFKFVRFVARNCPQCLLREALDDLRNKDPILVARNQELLHLALIAAINFFTSAVLFFMIVAVALNYGRGLADHFRRKWNTKTPFWRYFDLTLSIPYAVRKTALHLKRRLVPPQHNH